MRTYIQVTWVQEGTGQHQHSIGSTIVPQAQTLEEAKTFMRERLMDEHPTWAITTLEAQVLTYEI